MIIKEKGHKFGSGKSNTQTVLMYVLKKKKSPPSKNTTIGYKNKTSQEVISRVYQGKTKE